MAVSILSKRISLTRSLPTLLILFTIILIAVQLVHYKQDTTISSKPTHFKIDDEFQDEAETNHKASPGTTTTTLENVKSTQESIVQDDTEEFNFEDYEFKIPEHKFETPTDKLSDIIRKNIKFKNFINNDILALVKNSGPAIPTINNKQHYNKENENKKTGDNKLPVIEGKFRENNIVDPIRSKNYLASFLQLSDNEKEVLKNAHDGFLENLPHNFPEELEFKGDGILYAGGGSYNWLVLISLKMLRDTGSKLPVEVFIPTEAEYSVDLCEHVFPILGAKCIVMSSILDKSLNFRIKGYQLKSMALMLSSFENVLLLDSDNLPVKNPDYLFANEPFKSQGMVVWPDFWRRSTSPLYYEIVGIKIDEMNQVRFSYGDERDHPKGVSSKEDYNEKISYHDLLGTFPEASSESGQLLINKKTHARAIFLSLYYNYYGPQYYYGLMAQGQAGEGDKETYLAAAHELGLPYYQVQEFIREYGFIRDDGGIDIAAMGQYDPVIDAIQSANEKKYKSDFPYDSAEDNYHFHKYSKSKTMFLHCNNPKVYPWKIRGKGLEEYLSANDGRRRLYSDYLVKELGFDFELRIMETLKWVLCEHGDLNIKGMRNPDLYCSKVKNQIKFLETGVDETKPKEEEEEEEKEGGDKSDEEIKEVIEEIVGGSPDVDRSSELVSNDVTISGRGEDEEKEVIGRDIIV